jgi:hypothetical protein
MECMESSKSTKKTTKSNRERPASPKTVKALDAPKATKLAAKPLTAPKTEDVAAKPKSPVSSRKTFHRPAKPVPMAIESTPKKALAKAVSAEEANAAASIAAPTRHDVEKLAHSYWLARGQQGGNPHEDWFRAEHELRSNG